MFSVRFSIQIISEESQEDLNLILEDKSKQLETLKYDLKSTYLKKKLLNKNKI